MPTCYLIKSGHQEYFPYWDQEDIVSVGWEKASKQVVEEVPDSDIIDSIEGQYDQSPGYILSVVKCFAGHEHKDRTPMEEGDIVIIVGQRKIRGKSVIRGVAEVGDIDWEDERIHEDFPHQLHRDVAEWKYNGGPVVRDELSTKFQPKERSSTHLPNTLQQWNPAEKDSLEVLVEELQSAPKIQPKSYDFEFDESVIQAHLRDNPEKFQDNANIVSEDIKREYQTENEQFADFVFLSSESVTTVVETKVGAAGPSAVRQLKQYLQDIRSEREELVQGVLVAEDFYDYEGIESELEEANITLQRYGVTLEYDQVPVE
ncbi:endonuclease NucS domain-containing protein [Halorussus salinus]|uniref:endonuclease NucS domain-containing protein n=1 Tax=Halorussus salinus TaxID=1364935 RepID=UPI001092FA6B|nr:endonuclease NucS domain-containing protein [Halorussus salinus]